MDSTGQQRFALMGYIQKRRADGIYQAPLLPELFYGANGEQLHTWSQYLTAGDQTILRRDSGNPYVSDSELGWRRISGPQGQTSTPVAAAPVATMDLVPILALIGVPVGLYVLYKVLEKVTR